MERENICAKDITDKRLVSKVYKELFKLNTLETNKQILKWAEDMNRHFSNEDIQMAKTHEKMFKLISHQGNSNQNHLSQLEWQKLTRKETTTVGQDVEKGDPSYIVGGNTSWYSHSGKQCGGPLKVKN